MKDAEKINLLCNAVDDFATAMKSRLIEQHHKGKRGWDGAYPSHTIAVEANKDTITIINNDHQPPRKECIDVANRMMMLWRRG